jgi:hypothetical protein
MSRSPRVSSRLRRPQHRCQQAAASLQQQSTLPQQLQRLGLLQRLSHSQVLTRLQPDLSVAMPMSQATSVA